MSHHSSLPPHDYLGIPAKHKLSSTSNGHPSVEDEVRPILILTTGGTLSALEEEDFPCIIHRH